MREVLAHYEAQTEDEAVAEDEAAFKDRARTFMEIPNAAVVADLTVTHAAYERVLGAAPGVHSVNRTRPDATPWGFSVLESRSAEAEGVAK